MRTKYKSQSMSEVLGSYAGPDVDERTKRIILSGETNSLDAYESALKDLKEQERRLNEIGREHLSSPVKFLYRLADGIVGVTAFDYRVKHQEKGLREAKQALEFKLNKYKDLSETAREQIRDLQKLKRGARLMRSKYLSMETCLVQKDQEFAERIEQLKEARSKNPEEFTITDELDKVEAEREDYELDLETVAEEKALVTSKFVNYHQLIGGLQQNKVQLDAYARALRQKYFSNSLLESRLLGVSKQGLDPIGTMEILVDSTRTAQGVEHFADAATSIQLDGVQAALSLPQEEFSYSKKVGKGVKELKRKSKLLDNDLEELADRILEEESRR
ncbi:MAG: hypothetical protein AABX70_02560 [Nanoarchaeota archaeon]